MLGVQGLMHAHLCATCKLDLCVDTLLFGRLLLKFAEPAFFQAMLAQL